MKKLTKKKIFEAIKGDTDCSCSEEGCGGMVECNDCGDYWTFASAEKLAAFLADNLDKS